MEEKCKNPETKIKNILPDGVKLEDYNDILRRLKQIKKKERDSKSQSFYYFFFTKLILCLFYSVLSK